MSYVYSLQPSASSFTSNLSSEFLTFSAFEFSYKNALYKSTVIIIIIIAHPQIVIAPFHHNLITRSLYCEPQLNM